jgi:hypothetical protein
LIESKDSIRETCTYKVILTGVSNDVGHRSYFLWFG